MLEWKQYCILLYEYQDRKDCNYRFIHGLTLDDLSQADIESERFLTWVFCTPEFFIHVAILSIPRAVHSHTLSMFWHDTVASPDDCPDKSHGHAVDAFQYISLRSHVRRVVFFKLALVFIVIVEVVLVWVEKHCGMAGRH